MDDLALSESVKRSRTFLMCNTGVGRKRDEDRVAVVIGGEPSRSSRGCVESCSGLMMLTASC